MSFQRKSLNEGSLYSDFAATYNIPYSANFKKEGDWLNVEKSHNSENRSGLDQVFFTPYDTTQEFSADGVSHTKYIKLIANYKLNNFTFDTVRVFRVWATTSHPITNHPFYKNLKPHTVIDYYFAKNVGIVQLKIIGYNNQGKNTPKNHNWNLKYYKIIN
jgi:hypothetical protein